MMILILNFLTSKIKYSELDTIETLQHHSLSLTSSALDHSTTSTPYIYVYIYTVKSVQSDRQVFYEMMILILNFLTSKIKYSELV
jgi:hypothetical protein